MAQITINEGLAWLKTLKRRHEELLALRNDNAHRERRFYGASADKEIVINASRTPTVLATDTLIAGSSWMVGCAQARKR
jgi:hypothetical protein